MHLDYSTTPLRDGVLQPLSALLARLTLNVREEVDNVGPKRVFGNALALIGGLTSSECVIAVDLTLNERVGAG